MEGRNPACVHSWPGILGVKVKVRAMAGIRAFARGTWGSTEQERQDQMCVLDGPPASHRVDGEGETGAGGRPRGAMEEVGCICGKDGACASSTSYI